MRDPIVFLSLFLISVPSALKAQEPEPSVVTRETWVMGTRLRVLVRARDLDKAAVASEVAIRRIEGKDRLLSTWDPSSEMSRANGVPAGRWEEVSQDLMLVLAEADTWADRTERVFEPVVGALVDAWELRGNGASPSPDALDHALASTGPGSFRIVPAESEVLRTSPTAWIDTGGFGKGSALRAAARALDSLGAPDVLLDLGGQIWVSGTPQHPWAVSVAHPARRGQPLFRLFVHDVSVATSGSSERWVEAEGRRLGHILDPRTGHPVPAWGSVTVVSEDPFAADVLSTALYVMGPEAGMDWIEGFPEIGVLFIELCREGVRATWNLAMGRWLPRQARGGMETEQGPCNPEDNDERKTR